MKNTKSEGMFRIFFYPSEGGWVGVCPEFGVVHRGDDIVSVKKEILQSAKEYLEFVRKLNLDDSQLNKSISLIHYVRYYLNKIRFLSRRDIRSSEIWRLSGGQVEFC